MLILLGEWYKSWRRLSCLFLPYSVTAITRMDCNGLLQHRNPHILCSYIYLREQSSQPCGTANDIVFVPIWISVCLDWIEEDEILCAELQQECHEIHLLSIISCAQFLFVSIILKYFEFYYIFKGLISDLLTASFSYILLTEFVHILSHNSVFVTLLCQVHYGCRISNWHFTSKYIMVNPNNFP